MFFENIEEIRKVRQISVERDREKVRNLENYFTDKIKSKIDETFEDIDFLVESKENKNLLKKLIGI